MARSPSFKVRTAWWLWPYLWIVKWCYALTGKEPDWGKVERMVKRAMVVKMC